MRKDNQKWMDQFLENCERLNRSQFTIRNYRADLEKFIQWHELSEKKSLTKTRGNSISNYKKFLTDGGIVESKPANNFVKFCLKFLIFLKIKNPTPAKNLKLIQRPLSVTSRRRHLSTVKNFFEFLKQNYEDRSKIFSINPVKSKLHAIKLKDVDVQNTKLLKDEYWQLINETVYRANERGLVYLLYYAGLRLNEARLMRWKDIDFENQLITVIRKGGKIQTLKPMMAKKVFAQLSYWKEVSSPGANDFLFCGRKKRDDENCVLGHRAMYSLIMRILQKSKVPIGITPHSFRKGSATKLYRKTKDLLKVRDFLGHKDAQVTQTYISTANHQFKAKKPKEQRQIHS